MKKYTNEELQEILRLHKMWLNNEPGGKRADLSGSDLRGSDLSDSDLSDSDLRGSNLRGANLDYACLPLWCGSLSANFDDRQLKQIAYHLVKAGLKSKNASVEAKRELSKLIDFANGFHRAEECGLIVFEEAAKP